MFLKIGALVRIASYLSFLAASSQCLAVTYDLSTEFFVVGSGFDGGVQAVQGSLSTDQLGTFTGEPEIQGFLDGADMDGGFIGVIADSAVFGDQLPTFTINGTWDVDLSTTPVTVTATEEELRFDFGVGFGAGPEGEAITFGPSSNSFFFIRAGSDSVGIFANAAIPNGGGLLLYPPSFLYERGNRVITFAAIPEPSSIGLLLLSAIACLRRRRGIGHQ